MDSKGIHSGEKQKSVNPLRSVSSAPFCEITFGQVGNISVDLFLAKWMGIKFEISCEVQHVNIFPCFVHALVLN